MKLKANSLFPVFGRHLDEDPSVNAFVCRRLGEEDDIDFPQGKPGPGGGIFLTKTRQPAVLTLAKVASATALDSPAAVRAYAPLTSHTEQSLGGLRRDLSARIAYLRALGPTEEARLRKLEERLGHLEPLPTVLDFIRYVPHTLLEAIEWLLEEARVEEIRERLRGTLTVAIDRSHPFAVIEVDDPLSGERFRVRYSSAADASPPERDIQHVVIFTDRLIRDIGELLGPKERSHAELNPENGNAPRHEADGACSEASRQGANPGRTNGCDPRANAGSPAVSTGQCSSIVSRFPPGAPGGSRSPTTGLAAEDHDGAPEPARSDPPLARPCRERRGAPADL